MNDRGWILSIDVNRACNLKSTWTTFRWYRSLPSAAEILEMSTAASKRSEVSWIIAGSFYALEDPYISYKWVAIGTDNSHITHRTLNRSRTLFAPENHLPMELLVTIHDVSEKLACAYSQWCKFVIHVFNPSNSWKKTTSAMLGT